MNLDPTIKPDAVAAAAGAILIPLLEMLLAKGTLTTPEIRAVLDNAHRAIGNRSQQPEGYAASQLVSSLLRNFPERKG